MKRVYSTILIFLYCIAISCCNTVDSKQPFEQKRDPISDLLEAEYQNISMNTALGLQFFELGPVVNDFRIDTDINFLIINNSSNNVNFFSQDGVKIYLLHDHQYIEVDDQYSKDLDEPIILFPGFELPSVVNPDIHSEEPTEVLIVVTGTTMEDDKKTDEIVGAYIKCTLDP